MSFKKELEEAAEKFATKLYPPKDLDGEQCWSVLNLTASEAFQAGAEWGYRRGFDEAVEMLRSEEFAKLELEWFNKGYINCSSGPYIADWLEEQKGRGE